MTTNGTLYRQIKEQMETPKVTNRLASWLKQAKQTQSFIVTNRKTFNEWKPLRFYVTLGSTNTFSIRYKGQEVATLACSPGVKPMVKIAAEHMERNQKYFQLSNECQEFKWRSDEGMRFRKQFRNIKNDFKVRSVEHRIESALVSGLVKRKPLNSLLRYRTAVTFGGFPLQFPVPYSACEGTIGMETGHLDILGRKRRGFLSVWELKSPDVYKAAVRQAYIYALQIRFMINDPVSGKEWLELFGIRSKGKTVKMEIVVGISRKFTKTAMKDIGLLQEEMKADGIERVFSWSIANYNSDSVPDFDAHKTEFTTLS